MALDKKQIALTVGGIMAGLTLTYLLYKREQENAANAEANNTAAIQQAASYYPASAAQVQTITVPSITSTPSSTDTTNQSQVPAIDSTLESLLTSVLSQDNTPVTTQQTPLATITALQVPTQTVIPTVQIPQLIDYSQQSPNPTLRNPLRVGSAT